MRETYGAIVAVLCRDAELDEETSLQRFSPTRYQCGRLYKIKRGTSPLNIALPSILEIYLEMRNISNPPNLSPTHINSHIPQPLNQTQSGSSH